MRKNILKLKLKLCLTICTIFIFNCLQAQTDIDAITMDKHNLCIGPTFGSSSWKNYWEGTNKRSNANLGTVSSKMYSIMGNYGIKDNLNFLFSLPYIVSKASAGQLHSMKGFQDVALWLKYMPVEKEIGKGTLSLYTIAGLSFPSSNYVADYLPLSIGMHSTNLSFRGMADYQVKNWFVTASATYIQRSNVTIDRTSYYTTEVHYTNKVDMPEAAQLNFRTGIRNSRLIAEAVLNNFTTLGGFDITKNNMPFLSNKMNMTTLGFNGKYNILKVPGLSATGGANYTVAGRNVGQASSYNIGVFYIVGFHKHAKNNMDKEEH